MRFYPSYWKIALITAAFIHFLGGALLGGPSVAQTTAQTAQSNPPVKFVPATPKLPERGTPTSNNATGSRGDCMAPVGAHPLTGLGGTESLDWTTRDRPALWFYLPYQKGEVTTGEFSLQFGRKEVDHQTVLLPDAPGIVGIKLSEEIEPLKPGQTYRWYFEVLCDAIDVEATPASLTGLIRLVEETPMLSDDLAQATSAIARIASYGKHHIWYDTLAGLADLRLGSQDNPSLQKLWSDLLSDPNVGLEAVSHEPILGYLKNVSDGER